MTPYRALTLRREALAELATGDLARVAGGPQVLTVDGGCSVSTLTGTCPGHPVCDALIKVTG